MFKFIVINNLFVELIISSFIFNNKKCCARRQNTNYTCF